MYGLGLEESLPPATILRPNNSGAADVMTALTYLPLPPHLEDCSYRDGQHQEAERWQEGAVPPAWVGGGPAGGQQSGPHPPWVSGWVGTVICLQGFFGGFFRVFLGFRVFWDFSRVFYFWWLGMLSSPASCCHQYSPHSSLFCHSAILPFCRSAFLSAILPFCLFAILPFLQVHGADADNLPLTRQAQSDIWQHQHPHDCSKDTIRFAVVAGEGEDPGALLHQLNNALSMAMAAGRVLVIKQHGCQGPLAATSSLDCYFGPATSSACAERAMEVVAGKGMGEQDLNSAARVVSVSGHTAHDAAAG